MEIKFKPGTPQFRTALIRRMRNLEPDYEIEFLDTDNGTMFRLIDSLGRPRSEKITITTRHSDSLQTEQLRRTLKSAGFPGKPLKKY
ncbi:MAG: hypothetical protein AAFR75_02620 [Pseudomonadota bacterium]